ncbi:unnamed protein product [Leuciscus chuanchicus]
MLTIGGGHADPKLSEIDQHIGAIIGETELSGVPSAEQLYTDQGPISTDSYPPRPSPTSESDYLQSRQPLCEKEPDTIRPSCSRPASVHAPRSRPSARVIADGVLDNQESL